MYTIPNEHNKRLRLHSYSARTFQKTALINDFLRRCSDCGADITRHDTVIFDGITYMQANWLKSVLSPYGCYTIVETSEREYPNQKEDALNQFFSMPGGNFRCLRCGSTHYVGAHGLFGNHPSRWRCSDCGNIWEY